MKDIKLIVNLYKSDYKNNINNISIGKQYNELLNLNVFTLEIPFEPEQNIPAIMETAAINIRLINIGYDKEELLKII